MLARDFVAQRRQRKEVMESCKEQMKIHIDKLVELDMRKANIEIELMHYMKKLIYKD